MEHVCKYISIRALKRLCTFKSDIYLSDTQNGKEYLSEMIKGNKMIDGMSIFVCSDLLEFFVTTIVDKIKNTFVLVVLKNF